MTCGLQQDDRASGYHGRVVVDNAVHDRVQNATGPPPIEGLGVA
jgi:hypothetical protein